MKSNLVITSDIEFTQKSDGGVSINVVTPEGGVEPTTQQPGMEAGTQLNPQQPSMGQKPEPQKMSMRLGSSYADFLSNYGSELRDLLRKLKKVDLNSISEEQWDKVEDRLGVYDTNVSEAIQHWVSVPVDVSDVAEFAIRNQDRWGTEPKQVLNAIEDFLQMVGPEEEEEESSPGEGLPQQVSSRQIVAVTRTHKGCGGNCVVDEKHSGPWGNVYKCTKCGEDSLGTMQIDYDNKKEAKSPPGRKHEIEQLKEEGVPAEEAFGIAWKQHKKLGPPTSSLIISADLSPEDEINITDKEKHISPEAPAEKQEPDWQALAQQVSDRLGIPPFEFKVKEEKRRNGTEYYTLTSPEITEHSGVFKHGLRHARVTSFNSEWGEKENKEPYYWLTLSLSIELYGGGTNGIALATCWWENGNWTIKWESEIPEQKSDFASLVIGATERVAGAIYDGVENRVPFTMPVTLQVSGTVVVKRYKDVPGQGGNFPFESFDVDYDRKAIESQIDDQLNKQLIELSGKSGATYVGGTVSIGFPNTFSTPTPW